MWAHNSECPLFSYPFISLIPKKWSSKLINHFRWNFFILPTKVAIAILLAKVSVAVSDCYCPDDCVDVLNKCYFLRCPGAARKPCRTSKTTNERKETPIKAIARMVLVLVCLLVALTTGYSQEPRVFLSIGQATVTGDLANMKWALQKGEDVSGAHADTSLLSLATENVHLDMVNSWWKKART